jgi:hypothetical protein
MSMYVLFWGLCAVLGIIVVTALIAIASAYRMEWRFPSLPLSGHWWN